MALLKSLTGGAHALPIRSNSPNREEREGNPGVVFVGVTPTEVALDARELRACLASGKVEEVKASDPPAEPSPPAPAGDGKAKGKKTDEKTDA